MATQTIKPIKESDLSATHKSFYQKSLAALGARNSDYAIQMLLPIVVQHPGFLAGRKLLRKAEAQKAGSPKKVSMKVMVGFKGKIQKDAIAAIQELEEKTFTTEPFHIDGNDMLHEAAIALGDTELAAFALRTVIDGHSGSHPKTMHKLGEFYMGIGRADLAVGVYEDLVKLGAHDGAAARGLTNAQAQATLNAKNWETGTAKELLKDQDETDHLEMEARAGMTTSQLENMLSRYSAKYEEDPNDLQTVLKVADICRKLRDYETAAQYMDWATTLNPADVALKGQATEVRNLANEQKITALEQEIESGGTGSDIDEKKKQLDDLRAVGTEERIANAKKIVDSNPTDPGPHFILGSEYFRAGLFSEAIPELQKAKSNPGYRVRALNMLGKCYSEKNMFDLARNQFLDALKEMTLMDDMKKSLLYELGLLCDKSGEKEQSLQYLKQIYEADYGYRDVAERVEAAYAG